MTHDETLSEVARLCEHLGIDPESTLIVRMGPFVAVNLIVGADDLARAAHIFEVRIVETTPSGRAMLGIEHKLSWGDLRACHFPDLAPQPERSA